MPQGRGKEIALSCETLTEASLLINLNFLIIRCLASQDGFSIAIECVIVGQETVALAGSPSVSAPQGGAVTK